MSAYVVAGLGFGDEGKGSVVDYLARILGVPTVVRYNGGPQAAHHVVEPGGRWHCFSQFGSATLQDGVGTYLSRQMLVEPNNLAVEDQVLASKGVGDARARLRIDGRCRVVTPLHKLIGQMREITRGANRHGSVGMGVGEAVADGEDALTVSDLLQPRQLRRKLETLCEKKLRLAQCILREYPSAEAEAACARLRARAQVDGLLQEYAAFAASYAGCVVFDAQHLDADAPCVLEGAQGVLLDPQCGFQPHVTKTRTVFAAADAVVADGRRVGVMRAYGHRHGAGPFVTEDPSLLLPEMHNRDNPWQGAFRVGWFDVPLMRYALAVSGGVDYLVLTNLDRLSGLQSVRVCLSYEFVGVPDEELDRCFDWELGGGRIRIRAIRAPSARLLAQCRPLDVVEMAGWGGGSWQPYVELLERSLGRSIDCVSVGPTWRDKIALRPLRYPPAREPRNRLTSRLLAEISANSVVS